MQGQASSPSQPAMAARASHPVPGDASPSFHVQPVHRHQPSGAERSAQMATALGWFSIGIGLAQLLAPHRLSQAIGAPQKPNLMRALGAREIASGVGILSQRRPTGFLWSRVLGDAMDLALLAAAARRAVGSERSRVGLATAAVAGVAVLDMLSSLQQTQLPGTSENYTATGAIHLEKVITVNKSPDECYRFWRNFENFPRFMQHLESVQDVGGNRSRWRAKAPAGTSVEWEAEITVDQPGDMLAWRSLEGSTVDNAGTISFERAPGGRGTIVRVELQYHPPGGKAGAMVAKLFGEEPAMQIDEDLRRFKQLIETGEIPTTVGQPAGPRSPMTRLIARKGAPG
ncbi:Uncharacterized membrane protein [Noviherbaspirillum humi]|uniref:Uncharacterized membrane protein n=1 Tax=Noviherbaspirillum humi TaxID=1688639 RepID=A0A239BRA8_9BURK|nr:SRPBCC family protein [Noviherbaspirillum humi]SNS10182.1 Uncharacterized membrane protein [Noviherbaspirillum humi]